MAKSSCEAPRKHASIGKRLEADASTGTESHPVTGRGPAQAIETAYSLTAASEDSTGFTSAASGTFDNSFRHPDQNESKSRGSSAMGISPGATSAPP